MVVEQEDRCPDCGIVTEIGDWPFPCRGQGHKMRHSDAQIHSSEKMVVWERDGTGEIRIPGRGDRPVSPKYAAEGYRRKVIDTIAGVREVERKTGKISERLNYDQNSARAERDCGAI
jgi:hypothetical protein